MVELRKCFSNFMISITLFSVTVCYVCYHINLRLMNGKSEKQKEDIKLSIYLNYSCCLHAKYL